MKYLKYQFFLQQKRGFTLMEMLVVVLIIGILGAIALPQYQRAVLKSRFAALMPIAKSMADSNEVYYLDNGEYADNAQDLLIQGQRNYPDGTTLEFGTTTSHAYVLATRGDDFPNHYIVYQKHSGQFPGEIHCEADANDTKAQDVCKSFGVTEDIGQTITSGYLTYVLQGTGNGVAPSGNEDSTEPEPTTPTCPEGATCNDEGTITACPSGQTLNGGACTECDIANAATCSTTAYEATSCNSGYTLSGGACLSAEQLAARLQAVSEEQCPTNQTRYVCTVRSDGTVSKCDTSKATVTAQGECKEGLNVGTYETVYGADGEKVQEFVCSSYSGIMGAQRSTLTYHPDGSFDSKSGTCKNVVMTKDFMCSDGIYVSLINSSGTNEHWFSNECDASTISNGSCSTYSSMKTHDRTYYENGKQSRVITDYCAASSISNTTCTDNNYQHVNADTYYDNGKNKTSISCKGGSINMDGSCYFGVWTYSRFDENGQKIGDSVDCTSYDTIDWVNATCS